jgi:two-component system, OmpR family, sensor kinase
VRSGLRRRIVLGAAGSFAVGLLLLLVAFNVALDRRITSEVDSVLDARATAQRANLAVASGHLRVREAPNDAPLDGAAWVLEGRRLVDPVHMPTELHSAVNEMIPSRQPAKTTVGDTRLLVRTDPVKGGISATVVSAVSLTPYEDTEQLALIGSAIVAVVLMGLVVVIVNRTVTGALRPVHQMTEQAATWSEQDLHRRFDLGPARDEFTELAATLDGLLNRVDESFQHERRFSAEVAHELRTPLARQRAEAELALAHGDLDDDARAALELVLHEVDRMTVVINTLVAAAQAEFDPAHGHSTAGEIIDRLDHALGDGEGAPPLGREPVDASPLAVHVDVDYAVQTLLPIAENARRYARSSASIGCESRNGDAVFTLRDDGPGVSPEEAERIFEPGIRGNAAADGRGAGLGLPLARRLARAVGGDVVAIPRPEGGLFEVLLPLTSA